MKKINIVKSNEEFNDVIKTGKIIKNQYFVVYNKVNNLDKYRFGVSVGKKVCNAVNRNKLKRKIRNILDNHKNLYSKGEDYIIIIRKACLEKTYQELENNLVSLFIKLEKETKNEKNKKIIILFLLVFLLTGCTKNLKDKDGKVVVNQVTGQNLTENILCRPTDEDTIKLYEKNKVNLDKLPYCACESSKIEKEIEVELEDGTKEIQTKEVNCESFKITSGGYEGLWTNIFVKPLAYVILFFGKITNNYGLGLIITTLLIRLIAYPITRKTAMQSEYMKKAQPEMAKIEKKYAGKDQNDREIMMQKSQEMMMVYKKYNINPISGCLLSLLQLPLFIAFLEAINRVPAIFEGKFLFYHLGTTPMTGLKNGNWWYILIILLVAVSTYYSFKATSADQANTGNDVQKQQMMLTKIFPIMITIMSIFMTAALDIYWTVSNLFTILQNLLVKRSKK